MLLVRRLEGGLKWLPAPCGNVSWYICPAGFVVDKSATLRWEESGRQLTYPGMVIRYSTRARKRDRAVLDEWAAKGYIARLAREIDEATKLIDSYLEAA